VPNTPRERAPGRKGGTIRLRYPPPRLGIQMTRRASRLQKRYGPARVDGVVQGWVAFVMVTTHGIPRDVIEDILEIKGDTLDWADFERRMEEFSEVSRDGRKPGLQRARPLG